MPSAAPNLGAVQEHIFTSDNSYPNGVPLTGVPPASGWSFYWGSCCRNPCSNIINSVSLSWRLRAYMYPYNNLNVSTCFDNSPAFAEIPRTVICTGYPFTYNNLAWDAELDSLKYEWGQPLLSTGAPIIAYNTGYSYSNSLPDTSFNANNVAATMNPYTGEISFKSYTNGAFVTSTKVTAYKCGTKVAEIWRDMQIVLLSCGTNAPPWVTPPFQNSLGQYTLYTDTVFAGDLVTFSVSGTDFEFLLNGSPQTITLEASGSQFGNVIGGNPATMSTTTGCLNPPCAKLTPAPNPPTNPLTGPFGLQTTFSWQTDCSHLTGSFGCASTSNVYNFVFKVFDDFCPAPAIHMSTVTIVVIHPPEINAPVFDSVITDGLTGNNILFWTPAIDTLNLFHAYYIYSSTNCQGPFSLLDSVSILNNSSYVHVGANANSYQTFYYLESITDCKTLVHSTPSDTLSSSFVDESASRITCISVDSNGYVELQWKSKFDYSNSFNYYLIFRSYSPYLPFNLVDSITDYYQTSFIDSSVNSTDSVYFYYLKTSLSCFKGNNLSEPSDTIYTIIPGGYQVNEYPMIYWLPMSIFNPNPPYIIKRKTSNTNWMIIDSMYGLLYIDSTIFCDDTVYYMLEIYDSSGCFSISAIKAIYINNLPIVSFSGLNSNYCTNDNIDTLYGIPLGGTFSGPGITANLFDPSVGAGNYNIKYTYTNIYGCTDSSIQNVIVNSVTAVSLNIIDSVCKNTGPYIFMGSPAGGNVTGPGISGGAFHPNLISPGTYSYTYTYANTFGCISYATDSIKVNPIPTINFSGLQLEYCVDDPITTITALPLGGTFEGVGISGNIFSPSIAGTGLHKIKYTSTNTHGCTNADSVNVMVYPLPMVSITGLSNSYCINSPAVNLSGSPTGGTFSGSGIVSGNFNPSIAGVGTHNITYTYTDIHGCTNSSSQNVHVFPLTTTNFSGLPNQLCVNSQQIALTGFPTGGVFNGNGINGNSFVPQLAGVGTHNIYYVYIDTNGCVNQANSTIIVNPQPIVSFSGLNLAYCLIDSVISLSGLPLGGTFSGSGILGNNFNPKYVTPGFHTIQYSYTDSNSCSNSTSQTVEIYPLPTVSFINLDSSCCLNTQYLINLNGSPLGGTFSGNGVIVDVFVALLAGVGLHPLYYTFTDSLNCSNTDTGYIYVNSVPIADAGNDTSMICSSSGAFIGGPPTAGLIYQWHPTNGLSDSTSSNPFASPIFSTVYTITTTDILTNCSSSDDVLILLLNTPNIDLGNDTTICNGDSIELSSSMPALTYQWSNGDTSQSIFVSPIIKSSYILTITDGVCANADTIEVSVNSPFVSLGNDTIICSYDSIVIDAGSNHDAYLWNTGQTSQSIVASSNGISTTLAYSVTITDEYCPALDSINITYTKPIANLGPDIILYSDGSTILDAGYGYSSYLWSDGSTNRTLTVDSTSIGIGSKVFIVILTDSYGCTNTDSIKVSFIEYPSPETPSTNTVIIYPNPSDGQFAITIYGKHDELNFEVINALGQLLLRGIINSSEDYKQEKILNLSFLAQGVYSIKLENNDINKIIKIVVK